MSGSVKGGKKAAIRNKEQFGSDFYKRIGAIGGTKGTTGGFYVNHELAKIAGAKGGRISKRGPWTEEQKLAMRELKAAKKGHGLSKLVRRVLHA